MRKWAPCSTSGAEGWRGARALLQDAEAAAAKLAHYFEEVDTVMHSLERQLFSAAEDFLNLGCNEPAVLVRMVQVRLCAPSLLNLGCNEPAWCGACVRSVLPQPGLQRARMVQVRVCAPSFLNLGCNEPAWCRCVCALRPSSTWAATSPPCSCAWFRCVCALRPSWGCTTAQQSRAPASARERARGTGVGTENGTALKDSKRTHTPPRLLARERGVPRLKDSNGRASCCEP
jgi:hypothetical protein